MFDHTVCLDFRSRYLVWIPIDGHMARGSPDFISVVALDRMHNGNGDDWKGGLREECG